MHSTVIFNRIVALFIDLAKISTIDAIAIVLMAIASVGGVKLGCAIVTDRAKLLISPKIAKSLNIAAGCVTIAIGIFSIVKEKQGFKSPTF
jgi:threonine/homoserine/homoserine lactone efflux protein